MTTNEHRARLRNLATIARDTYGLKGRWMWYGWHGQGLDLCTREHGQLYVQSFARMGMSGAQPVFPQATEGKDWTSMRKSMDLARFEVCPEAESKDDPRVYRATIRGLKNPVAEYIAAADAETVLGLLDEVAALRAELAEAKATAEALVTA